MECNVESRNQRRRTMRNTRPLKQCKKANVVVKVLRRRKKEEDM